VQNFFAPVSFPHRFSRAKAYCPRAGVCFQPKRRSSFLFFCEPWCHWPDLVLWFPFCVNDFGVPLMSFRSMLASCPTAGANRHRASLYIVRSFTARPSRLFLFWPFYNYYSKNELGETFFFSNLALLSHANLSDATYEGVAPI
jgi:hypothetical protein